MGPICLVFTGQFFRKRIKIEIDESQKLLLATWARHGASTSNEEACLELHGEGDS